VICWTSLRKDAIGWACTKTENVHEVRAIAGFLPLQFVLCAFVGAWHGYRMRRGRLHIQRAIGEQYERRRGGTEVLPGVPVRVAA